MASEQGGVAAPVVSPTSLPDATGAESDIARAKPLKRGRPDPVPTSKYLSHIATPGLAPSPKSPRFKGSFSPAYMPIQLTGAAALVDERRGRDEAQRNQNQTNAMSENPGHKALASLMAGGGAGISRPQDAPVATTTMSEGMSTVASALSMSNPMQFEDKSATSPASVTSLASLGSTAQTATAISTAVAGPAAMSNIIENEAREARPGASHVLRQLPEQFSNKALSFPGNVLVQAEGSRAPSRGASLPMPSQQLLPRSPSQKKHKCPYCETEFTRHHNLKSHLLTHSQEKPYVCQTCNMRFRRLHDLKRHMKLHTGERPHICPKCNRKFARGDALARHSKGQGGCAGRRASMGDFGGEDEYEGSNAGDDDTGMDGIMYTDGTTHPADVEMSEEQRRRMSLPSIKAQHVSGPGSSENYGTHSRGPSTYPPAGSRPGTASGGLYPPSGERGSSSSGTSTGMQNSVVSGHTPTTSISSLPPSTGVAPMFSQGGMTESPKPLSPSGMSSNQLGHDTSINRQRSPSITTQFQKQHFRRRPSGLASPQGLSLPSPHSNSHGPKLPGLSGLAPPEQRYTLSSQNPGQSTSLPGGQRNTGPLSPNTMLQPPGGLTSPRGLPSGPSHHQPSASSDSSNNLFAGGERAVWSYVQSLEDKVKQLSDKIQVMESKEKGQEDKINRLGEEVTSLRNQLNAQDRLPQLPNQSSS